MLIDCKLLRKKSVFVINYNTLSVKYDLCNRDWYCDVAHLTEKVKFKYKCVDEPLHIIKEMAIQLVGFYISMKSST